MTKNPYEDDWSYGRSARPPEDDIGDWPPPVAADEVPNGETVRLSSGRWTTAGNPSPVEELRPAYGDLDYGADATAPAPLRPWSAPAPAPAPVRAPAPAPRPGRTYGADDFGFDDGYDDDGFDYEPPANDPFGDGLSERDYGGFDDDDDDDFDTSGDARRNVIEWAVVLVGAVLLALLLRAVLLQAFWIPSPSMESTLLVRDRVLVNKLSYRIGDVGRGDIVVFRRTDEEIARNPGLPQDVIKRAIALPGETIEIRDNQVFINGNLLVEPYLDEGVLTSDYGPEIVPEEHLFVMGDNRELSLDSRFETGPVSTDRVVGRAFVLFWPLDRVAPL